MTAPALDPHAPCLCAHGLHAHRRKGCRGRCVVPGCGCGRFRPAEKPCEECAGTAIDPYLAGFVGDRDADQHRLYCLSCWGTGVINLSSA